MSTALLVFHSICTIVLMVAFVGALMRPNSHVKSLYFQPMMIVVLFYAVGALLEFTSPTFEAALTARRVMMLGGPFVGPVFYMFTRSYFDRTIRNRILRVALLAVPAISAVLACTWPLTRFYYIDLIFSTNHLLPILEAAAGPWYYVSTVYTAITYTTGFGVIMKEMINPQHSPRAQTSILLVVSLIPGLAAIAFISPVFGRINLFSTFLAISCIFYQYMTLRHRLGDWKKFGRDRVLEYIEDAYVLVDPHGNFLDCNAPARRFFPYLKDMAIGRPISEVPGFPAIDCSVERQTTELELTDNGKPLYLRASTSSILYGRRLVCICILLYDITENYQLMQELNTMATKDHLTGLHNRGNFFKVAEQEFLLAKHTGKDASVIMVDIDFFKSVNDRYGHAIGDEVLRTVAELMKQTLRQSDLVGRYGGEEVCVYLPNTNLEGALQVAENLRKAIEKHKYHLDDRHFGITISLGVAAINHDYHRKLEDALNEADTALYEAKSSGRNKVCNS